MKIFSTGNVAMNAVILDFMLNADSNRPPYQWASSQNNYENLNLLSFKEQVVLLRKYNSMMPENLKQSDDLFSELLGNDISTMRSQDPDIIKTPFIIPIKIEDTLNYLFELFKIVYPGVLINPTNCTFEVPELDTFDKPGLYECNVSITRSDLSNLVLVDGCRGTVKVNTGLLGLMVYALQGKPLLQLMIDGKLPFLYLTDLAINPKFGYTLRFAHGRIMISIEKKPDLNMDGYCLATFSEKW